MLFWAQEKKYEKIWKKYEKMYVVKWNATMSCQCAHAHLPLYIASPCWRAPGAPLLRWCRPMCLVDSLLISRNKKCERQKYRSNIILFFFFINTNIYIYEQSVLHVEHMFPRCVLQHLYCSACECVWNIISEASNKYDEHANRHTNKL